MKNELVFDQNDIKSRIITIRNQRVILDSDLAELYGVSTKVFNQAVKRNLDRFPSDFMFELTKNEKSEVVTNCDHLRNLRFSRFLPYVFTEHGVTMMAGLLKSDIAIRVNIEIVRAFIGMRKMLARNSTLFQRMDSMERKQIIFENKTNQNFEKVFKAIEDKTIVPEQGIYHNGEIYKAYDFVTNLIKKAKRSILLIDNYVDKTTLNILSVKNKNVKIEIKTPIISNQLKLAQKKFNEEYGNLIISEFDKSYDRFIIIDDKDLYFIGASLKDLGKKIFAFSKLEKDLLRI